VIHVLQGRRFVPTAPGLECLASAWSVMLTPKEETSWECGTATERKSGLNHNPHIIVLAFPNSLDNSQRYIASEISLSRDIGQQPERLDK